MLKPGPESAKGRGTYLIASDNPLTTYTSNITLPQAAAIVGRAGRTLITTHAKPDGDAFGSVVALTGALRAKRPNIAALFMPPVPANFLTFPGCELVDQFSGARDLADPELVIVLDTGAWSQLSPMRPQLERLLDRTIILDHHLSGDVPAKWKYIEGQAAACCEVVAALIDEMARKHSDGPDPLGDPVVRDALFVGLASDTGWFRFSNTRPQTHELAARLIRLGVDHSDLFRRLEQTERPEKLALMIRALGSLRLLAEGRVAVMVLRAEDFAQTGAMLEETERFVDVPQSVDTVELVVLITQTPPQPPPRAAPAAHGSDRAANGEPDTAEPGSSSVRVSFRSKPGPRAVNVALLAQQFGGGGHARAAGAKVQAPLDQTIARVTAAAVAAL